MLKVIFASMLFWLFADNLFSQNVLSDYVILEHNPQEIVDNKIVAGTSDNELLPYLNKNREIIKNISTNLYSAKTIVADNSNQQIVNLEFISNNPIKQLESTSDKRFDLSGIMFFKNRVYVVADKEWNNHIYRLDTSATTFKVTSVRELCTNNATDFEGIDQCNDNYYLIDESGNDVFQGEMATCNLTQLPIPWAKLNIDETTWGNKGLEGIAYDCDNNLLYLGKEREPRRIFMLDLNNNEISEPFVDILRPDEAGHDIGDMKFENGNLYILERGAGLVTKIDIKTKQKISVSYQHIVLNNKQRIYNNSSYKYGMAEALMLTEDQIWIGLDNNGDEVSDYGKSVGLKAGNKPVIFIFKRPQGF